MRPLVLVKRRKYEDFITTNASAVAGGSSAPELLVSHPAQGGNSATFLRARCQFSMSVQVDVADAPSEIWWPVTQVLLVAWWSDSGSTAIGPSFGTSEHFLGTRLLSPRFTPRITGAAGSYTITYTMRDDLVLQTSRRGSGANLPHFGIGMTVYDPYTVLTGSFTGVSINWQGHLWSLWGAAT